MFLVKKKLSPRFHQPDNFVMEQKIQTETILRQNNNDKKKLFYLATFFSYASYPKNKKVWCTNALLLESYSLHPLHTQLAKTVYLNKETHLFLL